MNLSADYYEELQGQLRGLLIALQSRFTSEQATLLDELIDANESGIALEMMTAMLSEQGKPVNEQHIRLMLQLANQMDLLDAATTVREIPRA